MSMLKITQIFYLLIPDDFWKDLFMDKTLMAMVGPMSVLSLLGFIIPALLGILEYIKDRHIKYNIYSSFDF